MSVVATSEVVENGNGVYAAIAVCRRSVLSIATSVCADRERLVTNSWSVIGDTAAFACCPTPSVLVCFATAGAQSEVSAPRAADEFGISAR